MGCRRLVGIDLGIASAHTVRVLDESGNTIAKRKAWPTVESLTAVEAAALAGCPTGHRLEVVDGADRAGVVADRGVLHPAGASGVPGVVGEGGGSAPVLVAAHEDQRDRRRHAWRGWR